MKKTDEATRRHWLAAGAGSFIIVGGLFAFFSLSAPPNTGTRIEPPPRAPVELAPPGKRLAEEAMMRDLTPLFLPTDYNVAPRKLEAREPGDAFLDVQTPQFSFLDSAPALGRLLPPVVTLNGGPLVAPTAKEVVGSDAPMLPLFGFGRGVAETKPAEPRGGFIEVVSAADGRRFIAEPLPVSARPVTEQPWQPLEFIAAIDAAGLVAPPILPTRSGLEEVDNHFKNYLARIYRIGDRLPPGFYRITIGP